MIAEVELQRTAEWRQARCGKVTASRLHDVIARTQKGWGAARGKYMEQLVAERLTGRPQDMRQVRSMNDRADLEPEARAAYSFYTGNEVELAGFIQHPTIEGAGASPDGLVNPNGGIEIKCLDASNHAKVLAGDDSVLLDHMPQVHFEIACTGRQWWDLVCYCPIMPEELKVIVKSFQRDDDLIGKLEREVRDFLAEVDARVQQILSRNNGGSHA